jgi:hypothetical protein
LGLSLLFLGRWSNVNQFAAPFFSENSLWTLQIELLVVYSLPKKPED